MGAMNTAHRRDIGTPTSYSESWCRRSGMHHERYFDPTGHEKAEFSARGGRMHSEAHCVMSNETV